MKFIDERGRLFGKVNIIDFMVIVFLFSLVPMFYFGYKLYTSPVKVLVEPNPTIDVEIACNLIKIKPDALRNIAVGDKETEEDGTVLAEIVSIEEAMPYKYVFNIGGEEPLTKEDVLLKEVPVKLRIKAEIKGSFLYYKNKPITVGSLIDFKTTKYSLQAIVPVPVKEMAPLKEKWMKVKIKFSQVIPELARIISEGDTEKDSLDKTIGVLRRVISRENSPVITFSLKENKFTIVNHPSQNDITVIVDLLCIEKEGTLYFKYFPIKIGNIVTFSPYLYSVTGTIIGLE